MRRLLSGRTAPAWYVLADATALVAFVLVGLRAHRVGTVEGFLRNAVPLLAVWFLLAWRARTYHRPGWRSLLMCWIVAVPIGLLVRTVLVGSPRGAKILVFVGIGLAFTLLFLVLGRLLVRLVSRGR
jgi:hypothetical protein